MFFQVLIVKNNDEHVNLIDCDDKNKILTEIVIPYLKGEEFYVDGYTLNRNCIKRIKIGATELSARQIAKHKNDTMPIGVLAFVTSENIIESRDYVKDLTNKFLAEAKNRIEEESKEITDEGECDKSKVFIAHGQDNGLKQEGTVMKLRVERMETYIQQLRSLVSNKDAGGLYDCFSQVENLYSSEIPEISNCIDEAIQYHSIIFRNANTIVVLLEEYIKTHKSKM